MSTVTTVDTSLYPSWQQYIRKGQADARQAQIERKLEEEQRIAAHTEKLGQALIFALSKFAIVVLDSEVDAARCEIDGFVFAVADYSGNVMGRTVLTISISHINYRPGRQVHWFYINELDNADWSHRSKELADILDVVQEEGDRDRDEARDFLDRQIETAEFLNAAPPPPESKPYRCIDADVYPLDLETKLNDLHKQGYRLVAIKHGHMESFSMAIMELEETGFDFELTQAGKLALQAIED